MQSKILYLSDLKFNLETWRRELRFHFTELDTFEDKLEEIAGREFGKRATIPLEKFQNKIMIEKDAISKLMHRCKRKIKKIDRADFDEQIDGRLQREQHTIAEDMRDYIRMHYDLKEDMMRYFREWL